MHYFEKSKSRQKHTKYTTVTDKISSIIILSEEDFYKGLIKLRGLSAELILIPENLESIFKKSAYLETMIYASLKIGGKVKYY